MTLNSGMAVFGVEVTTRFQSPELVEEVNLFQIQLALFYL